MRRPVLEVIERNRKIFAMLQAGMTSAQIRVETGLPRSTLKGALAKLRREGEAALVYELGERNARIVRLAGEGLHYTVIAERLELSIGQVLGALRRARIDAETREGERQKRRRRRYAPEAVRKRRNKQILELIAAGMGLRQIARKLRVSPGTVTGFVDRRRRKGEVIILAQAGLGLSVRRASLDELLAQADRLLAEDAPKVGRNRDQLATHS